MNAPGLTKRLRQHSRRAGLAVGLSMFATIVLCIGSFILIYTKVDPLTRDFVDSAAMTATARPRTRESMATRTAEAVAGAGKTPAPTRRATEEATRTPTSAAFQMTNRTSPEIQVNLRSEPSTDNVPIAVLDPGTPLQYLGDETTDGEGARWRRFRTDDGQEGWLREGTYFDP